MEKLLNDINIIVDSAWARDVRHDDLSGKILSYALDQASLIASKSFCQNNRNRLRIDRKINMIEDRISEIGEQLARID